MNGAFDPNGVGVCLQDRGHMGSGAYSTSNCRGNRINTLRSGHYPQRKDPPQSIQLRSPTFACTMADPELIDELRAYAQWVVMTFINVGTQDIKVKNLKLSMGKLYADGKYLTTLHDGCL